MKYCMNKCSEERKIRSELTVITGGDADGRKLGEIPRYHDIHTYMNISVQNLIIWQTKGGFAFFISPIIKTETYDIKKNLVYFSPNAISEN